MRFSFSILLFNRNRRKFGFEHKQNFIDFLDAQVGLALFNVADKMNSDAAFLGKHFLRKLYRFAIALHKVLDASVFILYNIRIILSQIKKIIRNLRRILKMAIFIQNPYIIKNEYNYSTRSSLFTNLRPHQHRPVRQLRRIRNLRRQYGSSSLHRRHRQFLRLRRLKNIITSVSFDMSANASSDSYSHNFNWLEF